MGRTVIVKNSAIHGKGLFALQNIKKDQIIGRFKANKTTKTNAYVLWMDENLSVEVEGPLKYINHSKKPNACYYDDFTVVALKNINKDTEITHNYGDDWE
jgi:SET domain-containing protein